MNNDNLHICNRCGGHYGERLYTIAERVDDRITSMTEDICRECATAYFYPEIEDLRNDYRASMIDNIVEIAKIDPSPMNKRRATNVGIELYKELMHVSVDEARRPTAL